MTLKDFAAIICPLCQGQCCRGFDSPWQLEFTYGSNYYHCQSDSGPCSRGVNGPCDPTTKPPHCHYLYCRLLYQLYMGPLTQHLITPHWSQPDLDAVALALHDNVNILPGALDNNSGTTPRRNQALLVKDVEQEGA